MRLTFWILQFGPNLGVFFGNCANFFSKTRVFFGNAPAKYYFWFLGLLKKAFAERNVDLGLSLVFLGWNDRCVCWATKNNSVQSFSLCTNCYCSKVGGVLNLPLPQTLCYKICRIRTGHIQKIKVKYTPKSEKNASRLLDFAIRSKSGLSFFLGIEQFFFRKRAFFLETLSPEMFFFWGFENKLFLVFGSKTRRRPKTPMAKNTDSQKRRRLKTPIQKCHFPGLQFFGPKCLFI